MNDTNPTLKKARKLLKKIVKKLGNPDLRIVAQISTDTDHDEQFITYTAMISSPKEGVQPIVFAAFNKKDFIEKIEDFLKNKTSPDALEIVYYEAKILSAKDTIKYAESQIEKIRNPQAEQTTTEDEDDSEPDAEASDETK